jgi:lipoprotein NlpI
MSQAKYEQAREDFSQAVRIYTHLSEQVSNQGISYATSGRYEECLRSFSNVVVINANNAEVLEARSLAYDKLGMPRLAADDLTDVLKLCGNRTGRADEIQRKLKSLGRDVE